MSYDENINENTLHLHGSTKTIFIHATRTQKGLAIVDVVRTAILLRSLLCRLLQKASRRLSAYISGRSQQIMPLDAVVYVVCHRACEHEQARK